MSKGENMKVFFVEEEKRKSHWKRIFKKKEKKENKIIKNREIKKAKTKKKSKIAKEVSRIAKNNNVDKIIISKKIKEDKEFVNMLYSNQIDIVDGRKLYKILTEKIVQKICEENEIKEEEAKIGIMLNDVNDWSFKLIEDMSKKFKMVNVITNKINNLKKLQKKLYDEQGIIITVTKNQKRALSKANLIINVDYPEETINKYTIYDNSILINLEETIKIKKKRFCGKIINDYNIELKDKSEIQKTLQSNEYNVFDIRDLAEIYVINNPKEIENIMVV